MSSTGPSRIISGSTPAIDARCWPWREPVPRLVAESLRVTDDMLTTILPWPPAAAAPGIVAALTRLLAPAAAGPIRAAWPTVAQAATVRRLLAALDRYQGAMLADPIGSGKTFMALAVAHEQRHQGTAAAIVPAPLRDQWRARATACGITLEILSHSDVSRGQVPSAACGLVIIDESHHFRSPHTRRYPHLGRSLGRRRLLLVTATPAVNRLVDIAHQLRLGIRDDALAGDGTPSLLREMRRDRVPDALGRLVITSSAPEGIPARREVRIPSADGPGAPAWLPILDRLALADRGEVATLIRNVLLGAAGSSPAALRAAVGRYRELLLHAREAHAAGRSLDRRALRAFTAEAPEQLLLWELLPDTIVPATLPLGDLDVTGELVVALRDGITDPKAERLEALLADGRSTIVFTTAVATVPYLRDRLSANAPAWVTGTRAGWRHISMPREEVFRWFGPAAPDVTPRVLVTSDVAAEGLDLQRAERIIHYDLPWTAMRVAQREGRSRRLGARHAEVEVVTFMPPDWLEQRLHQQRTLRRKRALPVQAGISGEGSPWRWRQELEARWAAVPPIRGAAVVEGTRAECLVGVVVTDREGREFASGVAVLPEKGRWTAAPAAVERAIADAVRAPSLHDSGPSRARWRGPVAAYARTILRRAREGGWSAGPGDLPSRALVRRLQGLARVAAKARTADRAARIDDLLTFAARGHTAGEELRVGELLLADDPLAGTIDGPGRSGAVAMELRAEVVGVIVFVPVTAPP